MERPILKFFLTAGNALRETGNSEEGQVKDGRDRLAVLHQFTGWIGKPKRTTSSPASQFGTGSQANSGVVWMKFGSHFQMCDSVGLWEYM